jgi:CRP-like cAMP-binding protein
LIDENLVSRGRRTAIERTAFILLHLFALAEQAGLTNNATIQFPFTQQHLADTLGMSLVPTNKTLKRFSASNSIRWERMFKLVDLAGLVAIAGDDAGQHRPRPFI